MKTLAHNFFTNQEVEVTVVHINHSISGYGHKKVSFEMEFKGIKKVFSAISTDMEFFDNLDNDNYNEMYQSYIDKFYDNISEQVAEWVTEISEEESEKVKKDIIEAVSNNVVDYFSNSISASNFIEKHIKSITSVSDVQEEKIGNILSEYDRDFANADCDEEGATREQDAKLDKIIEKCANAISEIF